MIPNQAKVVAVQAINDPVIEERYSLEIRPNF